MLRLPLQVLHIKDTLILMNSPASWLILAFKTTCILRSHIDRYNVHVCEDGAVQTRLILIIQFIVVYYERTVVIKIILLMQWMMLLPIFYFALL